MKNADASVADLDNIELARLVYQGDVPDGIGVLLISRSAKRCSK